jgi:putative transposase
MPATHIGLYYHLVFSTKNRLPSIKESFEGRLHNYLRGILAGLGGAAEAVGGTEDHVHIMAKLKATHCLAHVLRDIKANSSGWVHRVIGIPLFDWQNGYGAFTVGIAEVAGINEYIQGQKDHHRKRTFQEEYLELLKEHRIEFDERYLW